MSLHVVPVGDLIEHQTDDGCPCGPTSKPEQRDDGSFGQVVVHHSLDGREKNEPRELPDGCPPAA